MKKAFSLIELSIVILIIGIIVAGVTQGSRLVTEFRLSNARNLTNNSPVASIKGLFGWWETTLEESFSEDVLDDGSTITVWKDINPQTVDKMDFSLDSLDESPTYDVDEINGLPALSFDASDDCLINDIGASSSEFKDTNFVVIKPNDPNGNVGTILFNDTSTGPKVIFMMTFDDSILLSSITTTATYDIDQTQIFTSWNNGDNNEIRAYKNGALVATDNSFNSGDVLYADKISIGCMIDTSNNKFNFFDGHIAEIISFDRPLKNEERESVEEYLGKKWGVKIN